MKRPLSEAIPEISGLSYLEPLGSGGYSDVYLYEQEMPRRKVAVKVLRVGNLDDGVRRQFVAEANAMAALADHPNIVPVFSAGETDDGRPFLLMSYYSRPNLSVRAAQGGLPVAEVIRIGIQIASAVETAHRAGILHRDIKPANILTSQYGAPGLTDFGIAAQLASAEAEEEDGGVSVPWAPPEVLYGTASASVRSDVYSLGATLWHLLVGRSPFEVPRGDNKAYALMRRIRDTPPPPTGRAEVPTTFERLLQQAMAKDPSARPESAIALARSLLAVEQELRLPRTDIVVLAEEQTQAVRRVIGGGEEAPTSVRTPQRVPLVPPPSPPGSRRQFVQPPPPKAPDGRAPSPAAEATSAGSAARSVDRAAAHKRELPSTIRKPVSPEIPQGGVVAEAAGETHRGARRYLVVAAAAVVIATSIAVGVALSSGSKPKAHALASTSQTTPPQDAGIAGEAIPPGTPQITATRTSAGAVQFGWTYDASLASDTFRWRTSDNARHGVTQHNSLTLSAPAGTPVCLQIKVMRADGSNAAVDWSAAKCSP